MAGDHEATYLQATSNQAIPFLYPDLVLVCAMSPSICSLMRVLPRTPFPPIEPFSNWISSCFLQGRLHVTTIRIGLIVSMPLCLLVFITLINCVVPHASTFALGLNDQQLPNHVVEQQLERRDHLLQQHRQEALLVLHRLPTAQWPSAPIHFLTISSPIWPALYPW